LASIALRIGFESTYVLVDKLDEIPATAVDPKATFQLVASLLTSLHVLEMKNICFKTFIWDLCRPTYHEQGGRQDRVPEFVLEWDPKGLEEVMTRRLTAYSASAISSLDELVDASCTVSFHSLASWIGHGSPRDMIRLCARVVDEHLNTESPGRLVSEQTLWKAVRAFSNEIASERASRFMADLMRLDSFRFTQSRVANDVLKITKQSVQAKVTEWRRTSMIEKIAEVQDARSRPQHLYAVVDPRLAIAIRPDVEVRDILDFFMSLCPNCSELNISDIPTVLCASCKAEYRSSAAQSLTEVCAAEAK
jgi:hypothetical protein